jgi:hypothetical protein
MHSCSKQLLLQDVLQSNGISSEFADTFSQLLHCHGILIEVEPEVWLIVNVGLPLDIKSLGGGCVELLRNHFGGVRQLLEEVGLYGVRYSHSYNRNYVPKLSSNRNQPTL